MKNLNFCFASIIVTAIILPKAAYSVTFDLLIFEIIFLFFKNKVKN